MTETKIEACRSCGAPVVWGKTASGKWCPYDAVDGVQTETSHFRTCNDPDRWSKKKAKA